MPARAMLPNRENCSCEELETAIKATPLKEGYRRLFAIKCLLAGIPHKLVAETNSISNRTLYNWIRKFNDSGIDGLIEKPRSGRPRKISPAQTEQYKHLVDNPKDADQFHWTAIKFYGYIRDEFNHELSYATLCRWLKDNDYRLKVPRPWPIQQDEAVRVAFIEQLKIYLQDEEIDIWFGDEMGVEGDPRPRRRWVQKKELALAPYLGMHLRANVTGIICPRTGAFYSLIFSHSDTVIFQTFLDNANKDIKLKRKRNLLILDNASWHKSKRINWGNFEPVFLPPYSPDLNPIERLWLILKAEWFTDFIAKDKQMLTERLCEALNWLVTRKEKNQDTCRIKK